MNTYTLDTLVSFINENSDPYCGLDFYTICNANDPEDLNEYSKRIRQHEEDQELKPCTIPTTGYFLYDELNYEIVVFDNCQKLIDHVTPEYIEELESYNE